MLTLPYIHAPDCLAWVLRYPIKSHLYSFCSFRALYHGLLRLGRAL